MKDHMSKPTCHSRNLQPENQNPPNDQTFQVINKKKPTQGLDYDLIKNTGHKQI